MTQEQIIEGNKLVCKFMKYPTELLCERITKGALLYSIEYHNNWNWLMKACKAWSELKINETSYHINDVVEYGALTEELQYTLTMYDIETTYLQLIKNLNWLYNHLWKKIKQTYRMSFL